MVGLPHCRPEGAGEARLADTRSKSAALAAGRSSTPRYRTALNPYTGLPCHPQIMVPLRDVVTTSWGKPQNHGADIIDAAKCYTVHVPAGRPTMSVIPTARLPTASLAAPQVIPMRAADSVVCLASAALRSPFDIRPSTSARSSAQG